MDHGEKPVRGRGRGRGRATNPQQQDSAEYQMAGRRGSVPHYSSVLTTNTMSSMGASVGGGDVERPISSEIEKRQAGVPSVGTGDSRGSVRGKRVISEILFSKPEGCVSKIGSSGSRVQLMANYFRILKRPSWVLYMYRIDFSPDVDSIRLRRGYVGEHASRFGTYIYDGTVLYCCTHIPEPMDLMTKTREGNEQLIKVKLVGKVEDLDSSKLQVLNLILRRCMSELHLQPVGRNYYDPNKKMCLENHKLEIWPGYQTSIRQHESDILLCVQVAHKVMRLDSVYNLLAQCIQDSKDYQQAFKRIIIGSVVLTDYNNKTYRVDDVNFELSPKSKFSCGGKEISFIEYYQQRYNVPINDKNQPLLVSRRSERQARSGQEGDIHLVPELCRATGFTDAMRSNFRLMKDMGEQTRLTPNARIKVLQNFNDRLRNTSKAVDFLRMWDMELDKNLVEVPGRILPTEKIRFGNNGVYLCDKRVDWTHEFRNRSMYLQVDITRWVIVVPSRNVKEIQDFIQKCQNVARNMRMNMAEPQYSQMPDDRNGSYNKAIDAAASLDPQILLVVLPTINEDKYGCIKKKCCVDRATPSQVVTLRTVAPRDSRKQAGLMSIATKVVIQMNAKLMGAPWMIELPLDGLMTVGFDVCHSPRDKSKSFGALVATMDLTNSASYFSTVTEHIKGQELSAEIAMKLSYALKAYRNNYNALPKRILFYRDGVSDGQLHQVFRTEVSAVKKKLAEIYASAGLPDTAVRFAFIVINKRINTRYFLKVENPPSGTIVDDVITLPERYDFYLVSQSVRQGTVTPTSYNVIYDTMGLPADKLQRLTYKMTHLYYNWTGTCRVPAVCQYAHKLAFLVAESITRAPNNLLENQLYFL